MVTFYQYQSQQRCWAEYRGRWRSHKAPVKHKNVVDLDFELFMSGIW